MKGKTNVSNAGIQKANAAKTHRYQGVLAGYPEACRLTRAVIESDPTDEGAALAYCDDMAALLTLSDGEGAPFFIGAEGRCGQCYEPAPEGACAECGAVRQGYAPGIAGAYRWAPERPRVAAIVSALFTAELNAFGSEGAALAPIIAHFTGVAYPHPTLSLSSPKALRVGRLGLLRR